ncbi:AraC family transcriptional regulator [Roseomonas sp. CAU 1739]|uniref:helix-turn-helix transcriptional regulator n=1 Tax=Roseomonas sp. CAU 1739 TaxID=3140364 RepID=UPI00325B2C7A
MPAGALAIDPSRLTAFNVVQATDPEELDSRSRVSERLPGQSRTYKYRLRDPALCRMRFDQPIFGMAIRSAGAILVSQAANRFSTAVDVDGTADEHFCFATMLRGSISVFEKGAHATGSQGRGLAYRTGPGSRFLFSDDSLRINVFLKVAEVEGALEHMLDERLREPLVLGGELDWSGGLAASLKGQLDFVMREFQRTDGIADNPVSLASMTDLLATLVLRAVPHKYSDRLTAGSAGAVPAYVWRAEEFMRAHCAEPIRMAQVAAAAGCSVRTLGAVFREFRGHTALGALHGIRLDQVMRDISQGASDAPVAAIARRYGFTNASRFAQAFRRRFGETAPEVLRRAARS